jgi:hypothetical protein
MTTGIKTSCKHKRELYLISRDSHDPKLKCHYKPYCKVLSMSFWKINEIITSITTKS